MFLTYGSEDGPLVPGGATGISNRDPIETLDGLMIRRTLKMPLRTLLN